MLGKHKGVEFTLQTRVIFSPEEQQLIEHYKMWDYSVYEKGGLPISLRNLAQGQTETLENVKILLNNEAVTKDALDSIPPLLQVLRSFGGEEVISYPRESEG